MQGFIALLNEALNEQKMANGMSVAPILSIYG